MNVLVKVLEDAKRRKKDDKKRVENKKKDYSVEVESETVCQDTTNATHTLELKLVAMLDKCVFIFCSTYVDDVFNLHYRASITAKT